MNINEGNTVKGQLKETKEEESSQHTLKQSKPRQQEVGVYLLKTLVGKSCNRLGKCDGKR